MPRLTNRDYLPTRHFLATLWERSSGGFFGVLPGCAQRNLHDFFAFTVTMEDTEALTHRAEMTAAFPSLPQAAGRALPAVMPTPKDVRTPCWIDIGIRWPGLRVLPERRGSCEMEASTRPRLDVDALNTSLRQLGEDQDSTVL